MFQASCSLELPWNNQSGWLQLLTAWAWVIFKRQSFACLHFGAAHINIHLQILELRRNLYRTLVARNLYGTLVARNLYGTLVHGVLRQCDVSYILNLFQTCRNSNSITILKSTIWHFDNLLTVPKTLSNMYAHMASAQLCASYVQSRRMPIMYNLSCAVWYEGTALLLSLTWLKLRGFFVVFLLFFF